MKPWNTVHGQPPDIAALIGKSVEWCADYGKLFLVLFDTHCLIVEFMGQSDTGFPVLTIEIGLRNPGATFLDLKREVSQDPRAKEMTGYTFKGFDGKTLSFEGPDGGRGVQLLPGRVQYVKEAP